MELIRRIYGIINSILVGKYDLVVPMDYGTLRNHRLPKAAVAGIMLAIKLLKKGLVKKISWAVTNRFGATVEEVNQEKLQLLSEHGLGPESVSSMLSTAVNSIEEIEQTIKANPEARRIIVVCDWRHAPRLREIWKKFFDGEVAFLTTGEDWDENHPSIWCRSNLLWLVANMIHHLLLTVFGAEFLRKLVHPTGR